jgi:hypothetical protein
MHKGDAFWVSVHISRRFGPLGLDLSCEGILLCGCEVKLAG